MFYINLMGFTCESDKKTKFVVYEVIRRNKISTIIKRFDG